MLPDFAHSLFERCEQEGIPLLLAGGWAVCHHGYSRLTLDVDWVCPRSKETEAVALMDQLHFTKCSDGMASRFKNRKHPTLPFIDLIWVDDHTFDQMAQPDPDSDSDRNHRFRVINLRALIAMKLFALKDGQSRGHKDLLDIRMLLTYGHRQIPDHELKTMCERYAGPHAYSLIHLQE